MQKRPKHFFVFYVMASWNVDVKYIFIPNWIHLDPLPCACKLFWLRSLVHAEKILDQIQKRTEPYPAALVCTGPKSKLNTKERTWSNSSFESHHYSFDVLFKTFGLIGPEFVFLKVKTVHKLIISSPLWSSPQYRHYLLVSTLFLRILFQNFIRSHKCHE